MSTKPLARTYAELRASAPTASFIQAPKPAFQPFSLLHAFRSRKALRFGQRFFSLTPEQSQRLAVVERVCGKVVGK